MNVPRASPAEPNVEAKVATGRSRRGRPRRDHRPVASDPRRTRSRPSRSARRPAGSPRACARTDSTSSTQPGRLETAIRATRRGGRGGDAPRIGILAEYDALPGLGHGCGHNTMAASGRRCGDRPGGRRRRAARRDRLPRHAGRGAGQRQAVDDRRRAVRRASMPRSSSTPAIATTSSRIRSRRRTSRSSSTALQAHAAVRPVEGQERPRRDGHAVRLGRPVAPAAPARRPRPRDHPGGRHRREHHSRPDEGLVHAAQPRPGLLRAR